MTETPTTIGERIKAWRKARGWSQGQLAFHAEMDSSHISMIERGLRRPKGETLIKFARAFNRSYADLVRGVDGYPATEELARLDGAESTQSEENNWQIEEITANLLAMRELDPAELATVAAVVKAMHEELKRRRKERDDEERRRGASDQPGHPDGDSQS
ncbi:MAG TPA: helix-turn-helix transcriptional regulator [Chloroflexia bacterium]|nr:helix-turn-helix transcriptional regulator [Chloroflexia bacterium]